MKNKIQLSLVMPVYNDSFGIAATLRNWKMVLQDLAAEIIVIDDGSTDGTAEVLDKLAASGDFANLNMIHKKNAGHGPAIRKGYLLARGEWIFQADSDNEVSPDYFQLLWKGREKADLVLGRRIHRREIWLRRLVTFSEPLVAWPWARRFIPDINVPFRLIKKEVLSRLLEYIPDDAFAPNVLMTILAARRGYAIKSVSVPHRGDLTGGKSLAGRKLWRAISRVGADILALDCRNRGRKTVLRSED